MARCVTKAATISHWNSSRTSLHLDPERNTDFTSKSKMTNTEYGGGENPEEAKKFLHEIIKKVEGLQAIIITDRDGIPIIKANLPDTQLAVSKPNFLASASLAVDQAGKLDCGKNKRIISMFKSFQVIHFNKSPWMVSLIANSEANTGFLLNLEAELDGFVEDLRKAIDV